MAHIRTLAAVQEVAPTPLGGRLGEFIDALDPDTGILDVVTTDNRILGTIDLKGTTPAILAVQSLGISHRNSAGETFSPINLHQ